MSEQDVKGWLAIFGRFEPKERDKINFRVIDDEFQSCGSQLETLGVKCANFVRKGLGSFISPGLIWRRDKLLQRFESRWEQHSQIGKILSYASQDETYRLATFKL
ncbi:hypothetical protein ACT7DC_01535 [Bacillus cereus]